MLRTPLLVLPQIRHALLVALASTAIAAPAPAATAAAPRAQVDARGFIDVWALRRDVAQAEDHPLSADKDSCYSERDTEQRLSPKDQAQRNIEARACEAAIAGKRSAQALLNQAWLPTLLEAVRRGDAVAEVILRQCSTTALLDRSDIESTCDEAPERRAIATRRLREIGFAPAFDHDAEAAESSGNRPSRGQAQARALARFARADFGIDRLWTHFGGNAPRDAAELDELRNAMLIDAALDQVRRAFTFSPGADWQTSAFGQLKLNRKPRTPGHMTWGRGLFYGGGRSAYTGPHDWLAGGQEIFVFHQGNRRAVMGGVTDADFLRRLHDLLAATEASIEQALRREPRWAVFLLRRVGHHEWLPEGIASDSGRLSPPWHGRWVVEREFVDGVRSTRPQAARAAIVPGADAARLRIEPDPAAGGEAVLCDLRYSGGSSFPQGAPGTPDASPVGPFGDPAAFEVMQPRQRYRQVLVQCPQGEWPLSSTVRMLFLAHDTLVEVVGSGMQSKGVTVRHWARSGPAPASGVPAALPQVDELARILQMARSAEAAEQALLGASTTDLIARLATSRNESLYYATDRLPEHVKTLLVRQGIVGDVVAAYRAKPMDAMQRFNLVMLLAQQLKQGIARANEIDLAADALVEALSDPHDWVRTEAVWGLAFARRARDEAAVLRAQSDDPSQTVRGEAIKTLMAIRRATKDSK